MSCLSVGVRVGMFVRLCFFVPEFGELVAVYSNENACISFSPFIVTLKRERFDVWNDGAVWKTVSV